MLILARTNWWQCYKTNMTTAIFPGKFDSGDIVTWFHEFDAFSEALESSALCFPLGDDQTFNLELIKSQLL